MTSIIKLCHARVLLAAAMVVTTAIVFTGVQSQSASAASVVVKTTADSYTNASAPGSNFGTSCCLAVGGKPSYATFLRFAVPADATSASLVLSVGSQTFAGSNGTFHVAQADDSWSETTLTRNNQPAISPTPIGTFTGAKINGTITVPLTDVATLAGQQVTFALTGGTDDLWLWAREHSLAKTPTLVVTTGATAAGPSVGVLGDSISQGCCSTTTGTVTTPFWRVTANLLGWAEPSVDAVGGSGYMTAGQGQPYTARVGPFLDAHPGLQALIVEGGGNDPASTTLADSVNSVFDTIQQKAPTTRVYVLGPYSPDDAGQYSVQRDAIGQAAAAHGFLFVDQVAEGWMVGRSDLLYTDGFHPTEGGHDLLGRRFAGDLAIAACHSCLP